LRSQFPVGFSRARVSVRAWKLKFLVSGALVIALAAGIAGQTASQLTQHVDIAFTGRLGGKPFNCGSSYENVGTEKTTATPRDLRFFVTDVALLKTDGTVVPLVLDQDGVWQYKSVALIDLEDGSGGCRNGNSAVHKAISGTISAGNYTGLRFTMGVPFELDHGDTLAAPSPLNMTAMFWSWQSGYKFLRAEVSVVPVSTSSQEKSESPTETKPKPRSSGFPVHIGSTGCASASETSPPESACKRPNLVVVSLPRFNASSDVVVFDFDRLLAGSDITKNTPDTPPGCMSFENDPDCVTVMKALGLPFREAAAISQTVFYAEPKP